MSAGPLAHTERKLINFLHDFIIGMFGVLAEKDKNWEYFLLVSLPRVEGWASPGAPSLFRLAAHRRSNKIDDASLLWHCRGPPDPGLGTQDPGHWAGINIRINGAERFSVFRLLFPSPRVFFLVSLDDGCDLRGKCVFNLKVKTPAVKRVEGCPSKTYECLIKGKGGKSIVLPKQGLHPSRIRPIRTLKPRAVSCDWNCSLFGQDTLVFGNPVSLPWFVLFPLQDSICIYISICMCRLCA